MVSIICPPWFWNRVKVAAKTWCEPFPVSPCPQARLVAIVSLGKDLWSVIRGPCFGLVNNWAIFKHKKNQLNDWPHIGPGFCIGNKTNVKSSYLFWCKNCFLVRPKTLNSLNLYFSFYDLKSYKCDKSAALPTGLPLILPNLIGVVSTMPWWCYKVYLSESPFLVLTSCQYLLFTETDDSGSPLTVAFFNSIPFRFSNLEFGLHYPSNIKSCNVWKIWICMIYLFFTETVRCWYLRLKLLSFHYSKNTWEI